MGQGQAHALPTCQLPHCQNTTPPGMLVCGECADRLVVDLQQVPGLALALETAHVKGLRFGGTRRPPAATPDDDAEAGSPVPFDGRASAASRLLLDTLRRWADAIAAARGLFPPLDTWNALPAWLCAQVSWLRSAEVGPEAVDKLRGVIRKARSVVDRPPDLAYAGPCGGSLVDGDGLLRECREDLYAWPGELRVTCRVCGTAYPLADRRRWLLDRAEDMLLPATELARAIDGLGIDVTPEQIRKWKERGRVVPHGTDVHGHPVYRVGDIMDLVNASAVRAAAARR